MKKAIQIVTPLLLTLAFGCNDTQPLDEVSGEAIDTQNQRADGESLQNGRTASIRRAGQLIKTQRILELFTQPDVVNPYADPIRTQQVLSQCEVIPVPNIELTDSNCPGFTEYTHVIDVNNCDFGNGDILDATLYVTHPYVDDLESAFNTLFNPTYMTLVSNNNEWSVDISITTAEGTEIDSCGTVNNGVFRQTSEFTVEMPGTQEGTTAEYEIQNTRQRRSLQAKATRSAVHLISADAPLSEVQSMHILGISSRESGLLPDKGTARLNNLGMQRVSFQPSLSAESSVYEGMFFHHRAVVDIPAL